MLATAIVAARECPAATVTWTNAAGGNWSNGANWSTNPLPPQPGDDVVITLAGTYAVTLDTDASINSLALGSGGNAQLVVTNSRVLTLAAASSVNAGGVLTVNGGTLTGAGNLTVAGTLNLNAGLVSGSGALTVNGPLVIDSSSSKRLIGRTLVANGGITWKGSGQLNLESGAVLRNTGTFDMQFPAFLGIFGTQTTELFDNDGTLIKSGGGGVSTIDVPIDNDGTVQANNGTLSFTRGGTWTNLISATGGVFRFGSGTHSLSGLGIAGSGRIEITGTANTDGPVTVAPTATLALAGLALGGNAALTVDGPFEWTAGTIGGSGALTMNGPMTLEGSSKTLNGRTLVSHATAVFKGSFTLNLAGGAVLRNAAGGTFDFQNPVSIATSGPGMGETLDNQGTLLKSAGGGLATIDVRTVAAGPVNVANGTLSFTRGGTWTNQVDTTGGVLRFGGGTHSLSGVDIVGSGRAEVTGGTVSSDGAVAIGPMTALTLAGGTLAGSGPLTVDGAFAWNAGPITGTGALTVNGSLTLDSGSSKTMTTRTLLNNGAGVWKGGGVVNLAGGAVLRNGGGATLDIQFDSGLGLSGMPSGQLFDNQGTLIKSGGAMTTAVDVPTTNSGVVDIRAGTLRFNQTTYVQTAGATILNGGNLSALGGSGASIQGGVIRGSGTITGNLSNAGTLAPGFSPGRLVITGNYSQTGVFAVEIGGLTAQAQFDQLRVNGSATLGGILDVDLIDGFVPAAGNSFLVLDGSTSGSFAGTSLPPLPPGLSWQVTIGSVVLGVAADGVPTSTPSSTSTATRTPTPTSTSPPTSTRTSTPAPTSTFTAPPTATPTRTRTFTPGPTFTFTSMSTATQTPTRTHTPTRSAQPSGTPTRSATATITLTATRTPTATITLSHTPTRTITSTPTRTATATITLTATVTPSPTVTGSATATATPTGTGSPTPIGTFRIRGQVLGPAPSGMTANRGLRPLANEATDLFTCEQPEVCLRQMTPAEQHTFTDDDGRFVFSLSREILVRRLYVMIQVVVGQTRCRLLLTPRDLAFLASFAGGAAGIEDLELSVDPLTEAAARLLDAAGVNDFSDEAIADILGAVDAANADSRFDGLGVDAANDLAESTAAADPLVQLLLEEGRATPTPTPLACSGDCGADGEVTVDELVRGVRILRQLSEPSLCPSFDGDLLAAVTRALAGCSAPP